MKANEAIAKMIAPGEKRNKRNGGVMQIHITRQCDKACYNCTQGSNYKGPYTHMTPDQFATACDSLKGYPFTIGVFGGNPAISPYFNEICKVLQSKFPKEQCGLWCNNPLGKGKIMRETFNPKRSNLNCHLDKEAFQEFKRDWPESLPFGHTKDVRHSPVFVAMKDVLRKQCGHCLGIGSLRVYADDEDEIGREQECYECAGEGTYYDENLAWDLISNCDINRHWSASIGLFRGELRGWFCEIAMAQSILHQHEEDYPDTGLRVEEPIGDAEGNLSKWWELRIQAYENQIRKHCHECSVPLRGYGTMAQAHQSKGVEHVSETHREVCSPKNRDRKIETVETLYQLESKGLKFTDYVGGANK